MKVAIIGRGKVGTSLFNETKKNHGFTTRRYAGTSKSRRTIEADLVILAVPDPELSTVATKTSQEIVGPCTVVHCAGALGVDVLDTCKAVGASVGVMHPLVSFADKKGISLAGVTFMISGDQKALRSCRAFAQKIGAKSCLRPDKPIAYHAIAAMVANGAAALSYSGSLALMRLGVSEKNATVALSGLLRSVADNVERVGVPKALTGPAMRGDIETVSHHRKALRKLSKTSLRAYDGVLPIIVDCAVAAGLDPKKARRITKAIKSR